MWLRRSSKPQPYAMLTVIPIGEDYADLGFPLLSRGRGRASCRRWPTRGARAASVELDSSRVWAWRRRLDTRFYEDARCQWQGNQRPWCCHPSILRQVTVWRAAGNEADHIHHRQLWQTVPESRGMYLSWHDNCDVPNGWRGDEPLMPTAFVRWEHGWDRHWHTSVAAHGDRNHPLCQPNFLMLHTGKTDQNCRNIYWTTTHRARSTPANISCYPWCKDHHSDSWSTLTPPQWPTTLQSHAVPVYWQEEIKAGLNRDVRLGVIEPVPVGDPVTYCHRMVRCAKKDGKPRRTVDMQSLNANATRETHHTQSPFHQTRSVPAGMKKTVFDAWNGYHSVALHPDDRHLTTFITPWGRYRYRVSPQGYVASGDGYSRRFDEIVSNVPDKTN